MKSNARCWTPRAVALLIVMLLLSACAMGGSDRPVQVCHSLVQYSTEDQARAADEVEVVPDRAVVVAMLSDYAVLRDQTRACQRRAADIQVLGAVLCSDLTSLFSSFSSVREPNDLRTGDQSDCIL